MHGGGVMQPCVRVTLVAGGALSLGGRGTRGLLFFCDRKLNTKNRAEALGR